MGRFQFRCKTAPIVVANTGLSSHESFGVMQYALKKAGFHGLTKITLQSINRNIVETMLNSFDLDTETFTLPEGQTLQVRVEDVSRIYGIPNGPLFIGEEGSKSSKEIARSSNFCERLGLSPSRKGYVRCSDISKRLKSYHGSSEVYAKLYILLAMGTLLNPKNSEKVNVHVYATALEHIDRVKEYDWARHVWHQLVDGLKNYRLKIISEGNLKNIWPEGNLHLLMVRLNDCSTCIE